MSDALEARFAGRENLWRHVEGRPGEVARHRIVDAGQILAGTEIHQDDAAALLAHHVVRLDVAVDEPCRMDGGKCAAEIEADAASPRAR